MFVVAKRNWNGFSLKMAGLVAALALLLTLTFTAMTANAAAGITLTSSQLQLGQVPVVSGTGFTANERIDLWLTAPDQSVKTYGYTYADNTGNFSGFYYYPPTDNGDSQAVRDAKSTNQPGMWYITAYGDTSTTSSIASFTVAGASLTASLTGVSGDMTTITYSGANFFVGENVTLWITDKNGVVTSLGSTYATSTGTLPSLVDSTGTTTIYTLTFANDGMSGPYMLSAHGNTSNQTVIAPVTGS